MFFSSSRPTLEHSSVIVPNITSMSNGIQCFLLWRSISSGMWCDVLVSAGTQFLKIAIIIINIENMEKNYFAHSHFLVISI